jgi:hypothetical protein
MVVHSAPVTCILCVDHSMAASQSFFLLTLPFDINF